MGDERETTSRGFRVYGRSSDDGRVKVVESSAAFTGPHVRIFVGEAEAVHLSLPDVKLVLAALSAFAREAEAGMLTEKVPEDAPQLYGLVLDEKEVDLISFSLGVNVGVAMRDEEGINDRILAMARRSELLVQRLTLVRGGGR